MKLVKIFLLVQFLAIIWYIEACLPSKSEECVVAVFPEPLVLDARRAPHALNHLLVQLHGWGEHLGVTTQDVAKVDMDQVTRLR